MPSWGAAWVRQSATRGRASDDSRRRYMVRAEALRVCEDHRAALVALFRHRCALEAIRQAFRGCAGEVA